MRTTVVATAAQFATGLLAGAFFYGWANVNPTFRAVPLDVHLRFRTELMNANAVVMQVLMGASFATSGLLAVVSRGGARAWALTATGLAAITFLVTRFGAVPINDEVRAWAGGALAADYLERLQVWETFNGVRVATAVAAFLVLLVAAEVSRNARQAKITARKAEPTEHAVTPQGQDEGESATLNHGAGHAYGGPR